jgi:flavin-binding protein dodecin
MPSSDARASGKPGWIEIERRREHARLPLGVERVMAETVYKVIELVGTSTESWEKAAKAAVDRAAKTLRDLRIAEVVEQDLQLKDGKVEAYRAKVKLSFKYEGEG